VWLSSEADVLLPLRSISLFSHAISSPTGADYRAKHSLATSVFHVRYFGGPSANQALLEPIVQPRTHLLSLTYSF
jgi:hypothetical protein